MIIADDLVLSGYQDISNHHADLIITIMWQNHTKQHANRIIAFKYTIFQEGGGVGKRICSWRVRFLSDNALYGLWNRNIISDMDIWS